MFVQASRYFSENNVASLRFDFLGCGDSQGNFEDLTVTKQIENLRSAIDFLENVDGINMRRIGLLGWSRGSAICILTAAKDKRIRCGVSWAGEADFRETWAKQYIREAKKRGYIYSRWWNLRTPYKAYRDELRFNILKCLKKVHTPFLFVHGDLDENVVLTQSELLYKKANKPKKIIIIKGADHSFAGFEKKLMKETLRWFKGWL